MVIAVMKPESDLGYCNFYIPLFPKEEQRFLPKPKGLFTLHGNGTRTSIGYGFSTIRKAKTFTLMAHGGENLDLYKLNLTEYFTLISKVILFTSCI